MNLYRRTPSGPWHFKFEYGGRRYRGSTRTTSEQLALKIARKRRREIEAAAHGITRPAPPVLLAVAADDWLELKQPAWAPKTYSAARLDVEHLKKSLGMILVSDITDRDFADYITTRRAEQAAEKTIRNELGTLRGILKKHKLWARLKDEGVRLPNGTSEEIGIALSDDDEAKLLAACAASRSRSLLPAVTLAFATGLRLDELRVLRWKQVDLVNDAIKVGRSKTAEGTGRPVPLNTRARAAFQTWAGEFPERKPTHYVFPAERVGFSGHDKIPQIYGTDPMKPIGSWKTAWSNARHASGVQCRFHDLRHTCVTRLLERGQAFAVVASIMGWSPATAVRMAKRYGHIGLSAQRQAMAALDAAPSSPSTPALTLLPPPPSVQ
jgi:integrase